MVKNPLKIIQAIAGRYGRRPEGRKAIQLMGHREYVGGMWEEIGKLQFEFLVQQGLKPSHCFLDIACGSLRGGVHFIRYLDAGKYLGIDKERTLIEIGVEQELGKATYEQKKPEFVVSDSFEFEKFSTSPGFSIGQSLFTHLNATDISLCFKKLRRYVAQNHLFFATFFEGDRSGNPEFSHSLKAFRYSKDEMVRFGKEAGWRAIYIGDWQHPRNQKIMKYEAI